MMAQQDLQAPQLLFLVQLAAKHLVPRERNRGNQAAWGRRLRQLNKGWRWQMEMLIWVNKAQSFILSFPYSSGNEGRSWRAYMRCFRFVVLRAKAREREKNRT